MNNINVKEILSTFTSEELQALILSVKAVLEQGGRNMDKESIQHTAMNIIEDAMKNGSLRESIISHADSYGIDNIEALFPDAKDVNKQPLILNNQIEWVKDVLDGTFKQPFSRIKSSYSDQTGDELRAKGYIKGNKKTEEVVSVIKRSTSPTTIYKKQKLDRDDIIDITDFSVVGWIKSNMRMKLNEELARCILVGDGRESVSDDYVDRTCIRPIHTDDDVYTIKSDVAGYTIEEVAKNFVDHVIRTRKQYKGSGNPTMYVGEDFLAELLLLKDAIGRSLYASEQELAKTLRVKKIVTVPLFDEGIIREDDEMAEHKLIAMIVNPIDYSVGADNGGQVAMFEDFDIDYNQEKYLIETRCSGALTVPYSAMVFEVPHPLPTRPEPEPVPEPEPGPGPDPGPGVGGEGGGDA